MKIINNRLIQKGFTLVELLLVIAMIGVLASIILINVASARGKANNASTLSALVNTQKVASQCLYDDYYLTGTATATAPPVGLLTTTITTDVCANPSVVGKWPLINLKSSNGRPWAIDPLTQGPVDNTTTGSSLAIMAYTVATVSGNPSPVTGDYAVNCTLTGCVKEEYDSTLAAGSRWNGSVSW